MTAPLPPDHADRLALADEVHARPPSALPTPCRVAYLAVFFGDASREAEVAHLARLCEAAGLEAPSAQSRHVAGSLDALSFKWERHGEFSGYTFVAEGAGRAPFADSPTDRLPPGWLAAIPGRTIVAAQARVVEAPAAGVDAELLDLHFDGNVAVGGEIGDGAGLAFSDFRIHAGGSSRFLVLDRSMTPRQVGRTLQRLFEIETYRMMALLALPIARSLGGRLAAIEAELAALTAAHAERRGDDETLLHTLTGLAARVESGIAASRFRFGACRAYDALVTARIGELREGRLAGTQTIGEFMARRFAPAVATCNTVSLRLHELSERVAQASALLATRVGIVREQQNQALLASMDRRAKVQLRLQEAVETLSIAAIVYYAAGLVGYLAKAAKAAGWRVEPDVAVGVAIPLIAVAVIVAVRRARRRVFRDEAGASGR